MFIPCIIIDGVNVPPLAVRGSVASCREVGNSSHLHPLACNSASTELYHSGSETVLCPNNMNSEFSAHLSEHVFCAMARAACVLIQTRPPRENCSIFFAIIDTDDPAQHPTRAPCRPYAKYVGVFHNYARQIFNVPIPTFQ